MLQYPFHPGDPTFVHMIWVSSRSSRPKTLRRNKTSAGDQAGEIQPHLLPLLLRKRADAAPSPDLPAALLGVAGGRLEQSGSASLGGGRGDPDGGVEAGVRRDQEEIVGGAGMRRQ